MEKQGSFLRKSLLVFLLSLLFCSASSPEDWYRISGTELEQIQEETESLHLSVKTLESSVQTLSGSVRTLEAQRDEYMKLSEGLRNENARLTVKVRNYRIALGATVLGTAAGILSYRLLR